MKCVGGGHKNMHMNDDRLDKCGWDHIWSSCLQALSHSEGDVPKWLLPAWNPVGVKWIMYIFKKVPRLYL